MQIWAHSLVKNEARWLWYSVNSIIKYVDKILLWDAGSSDNTLEIIRLLVKQHPEKVLFKKVVQKTADEFTIVRQEMLDNTKSDWFIMLDGDEIWWNESIKILTENIRRNGREKESVVVPTVNAVGDIFHYQDENAGRYQFGNRRGHFNLRAINRKIPGLSSFGRHGIWGWVDNEGKMIQDREDAKILFLNAPYLHTTFLHRGKNRSDDLKVVKRSKKLKYEIGHEFPFDFYYPEVFFTERPREVLSPWALMSNEFRLKAYIQTPLRKMKRKFFKAKIGY